MYKPIYVWKQLIYLKISCNSQRTVQQWQRDKIDGQGGTEISQDQHGTS